MGTPLLERGTRIILFGEDDGIRRFVTKYEGDKVHFVKVHPSKDGFTVAEASTEDFSASPWKPRPPEGDKVHFVKVHPSKDGFTVDEASTEDFSVSPWKPRPPNDFTSAVICGATIGMLLWTIAVVIWGHL